MTDMPNRIWAWVDYDGDIDGHWARELDQSPKVPISRAAEFVRADQYEALVAFLARAWRPIETAPKDRTPLLLRTYGTTYIGRWLHGGWRTSSETEAIYPNNWMPLPEPPGNND